MWPARGRPPLLPVFLFGEAFVASALDLDIVRSDLRFGRLQLVIGFDGTGNRNRTIAPARDKHALPLGRALCSQVGYFGIWHFTVTKLDIPFCCQQCRRIGLRGDACRVHRGPSLHQASVAVTLPAQVRLGQPPTSFRVFRIILQNSLISALGFREFARAIELVGSPKLRIDSWRLCVIPSCYG